MPTAVSDAPIISLKIGNQFISAILVSVIMSHGLTSILHYAPFIFANSEVLIWWWHIRPFVMEVIHNFHRGYILQL